MGKPKKTPEMTAGERKKNKDSTVHFASLMNLCHLKNSELEPQLQKYRGRVVLRDDIVKMIQDHTQYLLNKDHQHHMERHL